MGYEDFSYFPRFTDAPAPPLFNLHAKRQCHATPRSGSPWNLTTRECQLTASCTLQPRSSHSSSINAITAAHFNLTPPFPFPLPNDMNPTSPRILLLLLCLTYLVEATSFAQCLEDLKANPNATGGVDSHGRGVSSTDAVGLDYATCTERCGTAAENFNWRQFAQSFASWLLPWLALFGQLPFGSGNYIDDFVSG